MEPEKTLHIARDLVQAANAAGKFLERPDTTALPADGINGAQEVLQQIAALINLAAAHPDLGGVHVQLTEILRQKSEDFLQAILDGQEKIRKALQKTLDRIRDGADSANKEIAKIRKKNADRLLSAALLEGSSAKEVDAGLNVILLTKAQETLFTELTRESGLTAFALQVLRYLVSKFDLVKNKANPVTRKEIIGGSGVKNPDGTYNAIDLVLRKKSYRLERQRINDVPGSNKKYFLEKVS